MRNAFHALFGFLLGNDHPNRATNSQFFSNNNDLNHYVLLLQFFHCVQSNESEAPQYKHRQVLIVGTDLGTEVRTEHHMGNRGPRSEKVGLEGGFGAWGGWPRRFLWETFWVSFFGSTLNVKKKHLLGFGYLS